MHIFRLAGFVLIAAILMAGVQPVAGGPIQPLKVRGPDFVDSTGKPVRFWAVNLVATYPEHATADALAKNLASLQINLVRPHHNLRPGKDWNPQMLSGALLTYNGNSRQFDPAALDRFDYLNAALRRQGIYLALSINWTRRYLPGDVDILKTNDSDRKAWTGAMEELAGWESKKSFDVYKMLPVVDERAARLNEEFARAIMTHVNPYTGLAYGHDPQVLTVEVMNEYSTDYDVVCGNKFPDYWQKQFLAKWAAYTAEHKIAPCDLYKPQTPAQIAGRSAFLTKLDHDYFERIQRVVRSCGCEASMMFSNLWRGDNALQLEAAVAGHIEDHMYANPLVVADRRDFFYDKTNTQLLNKPYIIGELNEAEGAKNVATQAPWRTMLPLATAAYGSLQNWSGVIWFAWEHGTPPLGSNGWAKTEGRAADIGQMSQDGMMIDHLRTTGLIFRKGLIHESTHPIVLNLGDPVPPRTYSELMRHKISYAPGWQDVHEIRNTFASDSPAPEPWLAQRPPNPLVSDTGQITKDIERKQLTVNAPQVEAFSGMLDGQPPAGLRHLVVSNANFATVIAVSDDGHDLESSHRIIMSRTGLDKSNNEVDGPTVQLRSMNTPEGKHWYLRVTRPAAQSAKDQNLNVGAGGDITLPTTVWHECELECR